MPPWTRQAAARLAAAGPDRHHRHPVAGGHLEDRLDLLGRSRPAPPRRAGSSPAPTRRGRTARAALGVAGHQPARRAAAPPARRAPPALAPLTRRPPGWRRSWRPARRAPAKTTTRATSSGVMAGAKGVWRSMAVSVLPGETARRLHAVRPQLLGQALGQPEQPPLRGVVGGSPRRAERGRDGGHVDDAAAAPRLHARAARRGRRGTAPVRLTSRRARASAAGSSASTAPAHQDAGVVDQQVAGAERPLVLGHQAGHVGLAGDVAGHRQGRAARPPPPAPPRRAVRAKTVTARPRAVRARATASPMPRPPPVTMAVVPAHRRPRGPAAGRRRPPLRHRGQEAPLQRAVARPARRRRPGRGPWPAAAARRAPRGRSARPRARRRRRAPRRASISASATARARSSCSTSRWARASTSRASWPKPTTRPPGQVGHVGQRRGRAAGGAGRWSGSRCRSPPPARGPRPGIASAEDLGRIAPVAVEQVVAPGLGHPRRRAVEVGAAPHLGREVEGRRGRRPRRAPARRAGAGGGPSGLAGLPARRLARGHPAPGR